MEIKKMADFTDTIEKVKAPYSNFAKLGEDKCYEIDVTQLTGATAVGTHNLIDIPVGYVLKDAFIVVKEDADSAGDGATVQFKIGAETASAVIAQADLVAGKVVKLFDDAGSISAYCPTTADTLDVEVAVEALTALKFVLVVTLWDMDTALGNA